MAILIVVVEPWGSSGGCVGGQGGGIEMHRAGAIMVRLATSEQSIHCDGKGFGLLV